MTVDVFDDEPSTTEGIRPHLKPFYAAGWLTLSTVAVSAARTMIGADQDAALWISATAFVVAVIVQLATRSRIRWQHLRRWYVTSLYAAATWLSWIAGAGMSWDAFVVLIFGTVLLAQPYWKTVTIPWPNTARTVLPAITARDVYAERWETNLASSGALQGSALTDKEDIKSGVRYTIRLRPGKHTLASARGNVDLIRSGLQLDPDQDVVVEGHPELPLPNALLTIITRSPIRTSHSWPGPVGAFDSQRGSVFLGPFVDGEGFARWSVYRRDGMFGGFLQGSPGSGKSRMIESIALACAASTSHPTVIWYGDGQGGASSPMLAKHADYVALTTASILEMLRCAKLVMAVNDLVNQVNEHVGFHPTADRPGLLIIIDESHLPLDPAVSPEASEILSLIDHITRMGRKCGVAMILSSQEPTLGAFGGEQGGNKPENIRASLLNGNGVMLRTENSNSKQVFRVDVDSRDFPNLPGYAYLARCEPGDRAAAFRGFWVTDELAAAWPGKIEWRKLVGRQAVGAGKLYADRRLASEAKRAEQRLKLDLLDAGEADLVAALNDATGSAPPTSFMTTMSVPPNAPTFEPTAAQLEEGQRKVLEALRAGASSPAEVMAATGYGKTMTHRHLNALVDLGRASRTGHGSYAA